ncbi:flavohemoglobin expression-modulating QEGLA motif protein [Sphingobacterium lumbrici]|uniref:flavohemoglobin expression-modulating QEGLA motif protein n=1 Tax=Sphingobacterium lumbrici TaxID=2559600 RepID=UPI001F17B993|nr:flavohemoglobin expression-modulating QEGLA motif protein [Sphingobacterium lumbrici]
MMQEDKTIQQIMQAIKEKEPFHQQIPNVGKLVFNKIVPYLFIYRIPIMGKDRMLTELAKSETASVIYKTDFTREDWIGMIAEALAKEFGSCLVIEVWNAPQDQVEDISIQLSQKNALQLAEYFAKNIVLEAPDITVALEKLSKVPKPEGYSDLFTLKKLQEKQIMSLGISVKQRYIDRQGHTLPILLRHFRETLGKSLSRLFFEFLRIHTTVKATEFKLQTHEELSKFVLEIDKKLAQESQRFDFLLLVTPINAHEAWLQFKKDKFYRTPKFIYRPMPIDPDLVKRNLYNLRIEDLYDPTIAYLFRDKRTELDAMMSMLSDRGKEDFMHGSLQIFGAVSDKLLNTAKALLTVIDSGDSPNIKEDKKLDAHGFAKMAREEIQYLQAQRPDFNTTVRVRDDISGVMVNRGILNISKEYQIGIERAKALIQHEVGTHIVTYFNGKTQPLSLFSLGVPGYEQLQEGLAVFAEYLVGGLSNDRLRTISGRVLAVRYMLMGHSFIDTFSMLTEEYHFAQQTAFQMTMRVYRGGGLTKDALYLQGLIELIQYLKDGKDIRLLTVGKIREDYLPIVKDLMQRGVLQPPALIPRYLSKENMERFKALNKISNVFKLIN